MLEYLQEMWTLAAAGQKQGVLFYASLYFLLLLSWSAMYQLRVRRWPGTSGRLTSAGVQRFSDPTRNLSDQDYVGTSCYVYSVCGVEYAGERISPWMIVASHNARFVLNRQLARIKREDATVQVIYKPSDPARSFLLRPGWIGIAVTVVGALLPMACFLVIYR